MARIEIDPNYSTPTFSRATAGTDLFKKEDIQSLASAVSTHDHTTGKGLVLGASSIPNGTITSAMIANGTIVEADLADGAVTSAKILDGTIATADLAANAATQILAVAGSTSNPTTTSTSMVDLPDLTISGTFGGGYVIALLYSTVTNSAAGGVVNLAVNRGGVDSVAALYTAGIAGAAGAQCVVQAYGALSGAQTIKGRWSVISGTATAYGAARCLVVMEFKK